MDLSIVAAVGSFVVSERVLKPKATVLVILGLVLVYDLKTKTQDVSSLRVYRGPSLVALSIMLFAYSLRKWRRNGVACDELIFLPGTQLGRQIGIEGPLIETIPSMDENDRDGYAVVDTMEQPHRPQHQSLSRQSSSLGGIHEVEGEPLSSLHSSPEGNIVEMVSLGSKEGNASMSSIGSNGRTAESTQANNIEEGNNYIDENDQASLLGSNSQLHTADADQDTSIAESVPVSTSSRRSSSSARSNVGLRARLREWVQNHPHLSQLWFFFFNRSAGSNTMNATYAPSGPAVFGAALDLLMPVLFNFHVFILTWNHINREDYTGSDFYAKTLPIAFLTVLYARMVIPPGRRMRFWGTMKFTFAAPCYQVSVRDEFIGDCLTSCVRVLQDLVFATIYYFIVLWGTLSRRYSLAESGEIMAESWCVHNVILPLVAILPLWMKYLQTLRQAYDAQRRWPYLGNAFKYLSAALVIIYGTVHPEQRRTPTWMGCFVAAVCYQIFWDVVMDWQLFEVQNEMTVVCAGASDGDTLTTRPSSRVLLALQMYLVQPIQGCCQRIRAQLSGLRHLQMREKRLYKTKFFYWKILIFNALTRFTWMCCFIPAYHLSRSKTVVFTATSDVNSYWGVFLPAAELFRRTLWGLLYLEKETIKMMDKDAKYKRVGEGDGNDSDNSDEVTINSKVFKNQVDLMPTWLGKQQEVAHNAATTRSRRRQQFWRYLFLFELCIWAASFVVLGGIAAIW